MYIIIKEVKRGDADDEGIYLLAKDLAYNVALDQTSQLTEGIKQLTKKNMHDVSNAINRLDPSKAIDGKICGDHTGSKWVQNDTAAEGKCASGGASNDVQTGFISMFEGGVAPTNRKYPADKDDKMSTYPKTSAKISSDVAALNREQKGVVSSAFAKAHEGAEIVEIRSISTTSVMVNACYDVLTDGLLVHVSLELHIWT